MKYTQHIRTVLRNSLLLALLTFVAISTQAQTPVCAEDTVDLQLGAYNGNVQWQSSPDGMNWSIVGGATSSSLKVFPGSTTWYRAEIIDGSCNAIYSDTAQVFHVVTATISASGPLALCAGGNVVLTANTGSSYLWSNGSQTQNITVTAAGSYTVTVTDANGCSSASQTAVVTVAPQMTVDAGANTTTPCQAVTIGGAPTATGGTPPYTYNWTPTTGLSNPNVANPDANPNQNTLYTVTVTDSNGCSVSDSIQVNVSGSGMGTQTFSYTGAPQMFIVPCTDTVNIEVWGAQGGTATNNNSCQIGGMGGYATGDLAVNVGDTIWVYVGGAGMPGNVGGWNGGGTTCTQTTTCSRGGGASDVRVGGQALTNRVIVGGGGGGAEWSVCSGTGGDGGGLTGGNGSATLSGGAYNGLGGTQSAGGAAPPGAGGYGGGAGALGVGGTGGNHPSGHAGSGGGGYYGGSGGGADGHGGGGSSYIGGVANGATTPGLRTGDGQVIITW